MAFETISLQNTLDPNGRVFEIPRSAAEHSVVVRQLLEDFSSLEFGQSVIPISVNVSEECLDKVFEWTTHWRDAPKAADDGAAAGNVTAVEFTPWDDQFFSNVDQDMLFEILVATNYLDIKPLYDMACQIVADMIRGKSTEEIRQILNIRNDFTPEHEEARRREAL
ncbi:Skp1-domain-containing protein [Parathielavia appendiculata]|uniref:E3 ubiquitin ligase complex SCF subunit n=1 Tax=Parathielavia appendiculata TaxID=2587402 RepID=A0AAN6Z084_9PEZI|nr:Skp1-domain-containing protein [Parathielavia appendiculata]